MLYRILLLLILLVLVNLSARADYYGNPNAAAEHVTANSPNACRLSDGSGWISTLPVSISQSVPVTGDFYPATQPVSIASMPSTPVVGPVTDAQLRASALPVSVSNFPGTQTISGAVSVSNLPVTQAISGSVSVSNLPVTQAVSAASLPLPSGAAQEHTTAGSPSSCRLSDGSSFIATLPVSGPLTDAQLRASAVPVSAASLPLPAGAATSAKQDTGNTSVASIDNKTPALGQTTMSASVPVAIASNQSAVPISAAALPLPSGASTAAKQPALGTAGSASADVITIQGITSMTPVKTDGSGVTQPVSIAGTVTISPVSTGGNPCQNPGTTLLSATGATSGTAAVQIIALSGSTKIYLCSLNVMGVSGTSPTFSLVQGTGSNCATGQTKVVQAWTTGAGTLYPFAAPVAVGVAGNALCYLDTGTTPIQNYTLTYVQQ